MKPFKNYVDQDTSDGDLRKPFESHGKVTDIFNPGKGFAFVTFSTPGEAQAAIKAMDGTNVCGRDIQCSLARKRREETKTEKKLRMRMKEMEAEIEELK